MAHDSGEILEQFFGRLRRELGGRVCKLTGQPLTEYQQQVIANGILHIMVDTLGGCRLTFPDMADYQRMQRDSRIRSAFNGRNYEELACQFNMSSAQVRRVVSGPRAKHN